MQDFSGLVILKNGDIKDTIIKPSEINGDLYKKCNFRKSEGFDEQCKWDVKVNKVKYQVKVFGRKVGKSGTENKYEFPPPIDTTLFFGNMLVLSFVAEEPVDLTQELWAKIYEKLFGGFENLDDTKEEDDKEGKTRDSKTRQEQSRLCSKSRADSGTVSHILPIDLVPVASHS